MGEMAHRDTRGYVKWIVRMTAHTAMITKAMVSMLTVMW